MCASEDSDQPGHPPSLIRGFAVRMKRVWVLSYPLSAQRRHWSDWAHKSFCWFCHEAAHLPIAQNNRTLGIKGLTVLKLSQLMRLWHFSSSVNSFFKQSPVWLDIWFLVRAFVYFHTSCMWTAKALARLRGCLCDKYHNLMSWLNFHNKLCRNSLFCLFIFFDLLFN